MSGEPIKDRWGGVPDYVYVNGKLRHQPTGLEVPVKPVRRSRRNAELRKAHTKLKAMAKAELKRYD